MHNTTLDQWFWSVEPGKLGFRKARQKVSRDYICLPIISIKEQNNMFCVENFL
jgi:hypothetical protein